MVSQVIDQAVHDGRGEIAKYRCSRSQLITVARAAECSLQSTMNSLLIEPHYNDQSHEVPRRDDLEARLFYLLYSFVSGG